MKTLNWIGRERAEVFESQGAQRPGTVDALVTGGYSLFAAVPLAIALTSSLFSGGMGLVAWASLALSGAVITSLARGFIARYIRS
jgi:hypothetical protein